MFPFASDLARDARRRAAVLLAVVIVALAALAWPAEAQARFNEATDSFPAAQDLGTYGAPIYADQLPDGAYQVSARTTSRMCILYTNPADADARDSKEQAIVLVEGGSLTAVFYISKAYTHLYIGTQEEAAAATNEDGTDASAYIAGDPDEGYVPHMFALPIAALNESITIATFSGGDHGIEEGKWYTRQVVFSMTDAEFQAITAPVDASQDGGSDDGAQADADAGVDADADVEDAGAEDAASSAEDLDDGAEDSDGVVASIEEAPVAQEQPEYEEPDQAPVALEAGNVVAAGSQDGGGQGGGQGADEAASDAQGAGEDDRPDQAASKENAPAAPVNLRGVRMNIVDSTVTIDVDQGIAPEAQEARRPLLTPQQTLALVLLAALAAGAAARVVVFARAYEKGGQVALGPQKGQGACS